MNRLADSRVSTTIQAVIFDLDGLLLNSEWMSFRVWCELAEQHGGQLDDEDYRKMAGISAEATADYLIQNKGIQIDAAESTAWAWKEVTRRMKAQGKSMPGSIELVQTLSARGYPLAVASNSITSYIDAALSWLGLLDSFPVRVSIEQVKEGKPAPDVYLSAAARLGVQPERCLALEDSRTGVQAAAAAGMRVIAVPGAHDHPEGFHGAWKIYESLQKVSDDLDTVLN